MRWSLYAPVCPVCMHACLWEQVMQAQVYKYAHRRAAASLMKQQSGAFISSELHEEESEVVACWHAGVTEIKVPCVACCVYFLCDLSCPRAAWMSCRFAR